MWNRLFSLSPRPTAYLLFESGHTATGRDRARQFPNLLFSFVIKRIMAEKSKTSDIQCRRCWLHNRTPSAHHSIAWKWIFRAFIVLTMHAVRSSSLYDIDGAHFLSSGASTLHRPSSVRPSVRSRSVQTDRVADRTSRKIVSNLLSCTYAKWEMIVMMMGAGCRLNCSSAVRRYQTMCIMRLSPAPTLSFSLHSVSSVSFACLCRSGVLAVEADWALNSR